MDSTLILVKTSKGVDEIKNRAFGLPQHLRALLIMADGSTSLSTLLNRTAQMPQAQEDIAWLVREGFVESTSGTHRAGSSPAAALPPRQMLIALARELLGPDAPKVIQRLEEAPESLPELGSAIERCHKFIKLTIDEKKAEQFLQAGRGLLAEVR